MKGKELFQIGKYVCWVDYQVEPRKEPELLAIEFEPKLYAEDVQYRCDVIVPIGQTIASPQMVLRYLRDCYIDDESLFNHIEKEI